MNALHHNAAAASTLALSSGGDVAAQRFPASNLAVRPQRAAAHIAIRKLAKTFRQMTLSYGRRATRPKRSLRAIAPRIRCVAAPLPMHGDSKVQLLNGHFDA